MSKPSRTIHRWPCGARFQNCGITCSHRTHRRCPLQRHDRTRPRPRLIFHSGLGQYTPAAFAELATDCQVARYLGPTDQCWDNALAESLLASIKVEVIDPAPAPPAPGPTTLSSKCIGWFNGSQTSLGVLELLYDVAFERFMERFCNTSATCGACCRRCSEPC